jgi:hypothetical protein
MTDPIKPITDAWDTPEEDAAWKYLEGAVFEKKPLTIKELWNAWSFDWGMDQPCPYIWFGWWLITFDPKFEISFLPD